MKTREFRPTVDSAKLEDRLVMTRFSPFFFSPFFFAPTTPVTTVSNVSNVGVAININYVGATPRSALNQAAALNAANPAVAVPGTGTQTLAQAQAYLNSLITLFGTKLAQGTQAAMIFLPASATTAANIITDTNNKLTIPLQTALNTLNASAGTQTDIDTAINTAQGIATAANIQTAATEANTILQGYTTTVAVLPFGLGFRRFFFF
jgi:hypothetical protein